LTFTWFVLPNGLLLCGDATRIHVDIHLVPDGQNWAEVAAAQKSCARAKAPDWKKIETLRLRKKTKNLCKRAAFAVAFKQQCRQFPELKKMRDDRKGLRVTNPWSQPIGFDLRTLC